MKTIRTMLYGDCEFSEWELELLHTPIMQRMYNIKQLGFTDKVYPDAIHSRFNHILGVASRSEKITDGIVKSLINEQQGTLPGRKNFNCNGKEIPIADLIEHVINRKQVIRLIALLHDIGHIPFGHTLEDELKVFEVSHDEPIRQVKFFNILIKEFLYAIIIGHDPSPEKKLLDIVISNENNEEDDLLLINNFKIAIARIKERYQDTNVSKYEEFLIEIETSMIALFYLDDLHKNRINVSKYKSKRDDAISKLLISKVIQSCDINRNEKQMEFDVYLDAFTLDIIGNTICADLLDYAKRDCKQAGLIYDYDDRLFKYFTLVSNTREESETPYIQVAIQVYTHKLRSDVVSEIITILRTRYLLSERVLYHPTKCSAGAMLGCVVYMMGIDRAELDFFRIGDAVFLRLLEHHSDALHKIINEITEKYRIEKEIGEDLYNIVTKNKTVQNEPDLNPIAEFLEKHSETFIHFTNKTNLVRAFHKIFNEEAEMNRKNSKQSLFIDERQIQKFVEQINERIFSAKKIVWQIQSRQFFKKIFRIAKIGDSATNTIKKTLADKFKNAQFRYGFERTIELEAGLPYGTIVIHCPRFDTAMKPADVLIFGANPNKVIAFKEITDDAHELISLSEYVKEAKAIETSYLNIWNMYFFVQQAQMHRWPLINIIIKKHLNSSVNLTNEISNSNDLINQLRNEYSEPAKKVLSVLDYVESENCNPKPKIDVSFVDFIESEVFHGKKEAGDLLAKTIVNEWNKTLSNGKD